MANRAYLYSANSPDAWERPDQDYYDSRWVIPLAWFFFYRSEDVRLIDFPRDNPGWQEVKLVAEKEPAVALFKIREPLLVALVEGRIDRGEIAEFLATVGRRPGKYLLMDPEEVVMGGADEDSVHAERFTRILTALGSGEGPTEITRGVFWPYLSQFDSDVDRCRGQIIGYTYTWPS